MKKSQPLPPSQEGCKKNYPAFNSKKQAQTDFIIEDVKITNPTKFFYKESGITKGDAPVPISWDELDTTSSKSITTADAGAKLRRKDPWEDFFQNRQLFKTNIYPSILFWNSLIFHS